MPADRVEVIVSLRGLRMSGAEIAELFGMALSTVSTILQRQGRGRLGRIGLEQPIRYERSRPGELVHLDVKKLGRIQGSAGKRVTGVTRNPRPRRRDAHGVDRGLIGWEYVHVAVDDYSRYADVEVLTDEKAATAAAFLRRAVEAYRRRGIQVERILTDNGACYQGVLHALACRQLGINHSRTRPYRPQNQRQSRALHPHDAPGLGLRRRIPLKPRTHRRP